MYVISLPNSILSAFHELGFHHRGLLHFPLPFLSDQPLDKKYEKLYSIPNHLLDNLVYIRLQVFYHHLLATYSHQD
ncbi:hypothetical protein LEP1GSC061_0107 [Leptospira wolffii serovar Khorat str. Khorat-H2]|nr:hypothetical protein LEP1GSC061_0107 [Leptospira wolffii serovar Khorat str. Khorat-H2]